MTDTFVTALGLGIAGIDPVGALLLMTAIAAHFTRSKIILFTLVVLVSAVIAGTLLSVLGAGLIGSIRNAFPGNTSGVWVYVNLVIAVITIAWLIRRYRNRNKPRSEKSGNKLRNSYYAIALTATLFGASSVPDPTFLATISLAAQTNNLGTIITMHTIWMLVSQIMLFVLFMAYLNGKHEKIIDFSLQQFAKHKNVMQATVYVAAVLVVAVLIADSSNYLFNDRYLINL